VILSNKILDKNYSSNDKSSSNLTNEATRMPINPITTYLRYKFPTHPLSFNYPNGMLMADSLRQSTESIDLKYKDYTLKIISNSPGLGFGEPAPEMTEVDLIVDGKEVFINNQKITKARLNYIDSNTIGYLLFIHYPEEYNFNFGVLVSYGFENGVEDQETIEVFDRIISTLSFGNQSDLTKLINTTTSNILIEYIN
jgi:hypothetical protein